MKKIFIIIILILVANQSLFSFDLDSLLIKSLGGEKALTAVKNMTSYQTSGKFTLNNQTGTFKQYYQPPDKFYLEAKFLSFVLIQAYDGKTAWQKTMNGKITEMAGPEKDDMLSSLYMESVSYLLDGRFPGSKEYLGIENIDSVDYHEVAFYPFDNDTIINYFDIKTGMKKISLQDQDMIKTRTKISDYRLIDDILVPFKTETEMIGLSFGTIFEVEEASFNQPLDPSIFSMESETLTDYYFPGNKSLVNIPFEYRNGHILIPAFINGSKKVIFILDSGASANILNTGVVDKLNLEISGTIPSIGIGGFEDVSLVIPDSINIGSLTLYNQIAGKLDLSMLSKAFNLDEELGGLLGYDFISRFPILIDYDNQLLTVYKPDNFNPPERGIEIPFHLVMQIPTITAEINAIPGEFIVDLGNAVGLVLHHDFVKQNDIENSLDDVKKNESKIGGIGGDLGGKNGFAATFKMGDVVINSLRVFLPDSSMGLSGSKDLAGNIGNRILDNFLVLFDYQNSRLILYDKE